MKIDRYWLIAIMLFVLALFNKNEAYGHYRPVLIMLSFIISIPIVLKYKNAYHLKYLLILYLWSFLTFFIAENKSMASGQVTNGTAALLTCLSFFALAQKKFFIPIAYIIHIISIAVLAKFAYDNIYLPSAAYQVFGQDRFGESGVVNANTFAYYLFYLTFIIYILGDILKGRFSKYIKIVFFLIIPLTFFVAILTASRQVFIIQIPLITVLLLLRYSVKFSRFSFVAIVLGLLALVFLPRLTEVYSDSLLAERNKMEAVGEDARVEIAKSAIVVGTEHFFTGVGIGNFPTKSGGPMAHNSYLELYADTGIVGILVYIFLTFGFVKRQYNRYKQTKDRNYLSFMFFGIFFIFDNFFFVFYGDYGLMSFYILVVTHAEIYHRDKTKLGMSQLVRKYN